MPFRDAYRTALDEPEALLHRTPEASLAARISPGGAANLRLDELRARLSASEMITTETNAAASTNAGKIGSG